MRGGMQESRGEPTTTPGKDLTSRQRELLATIVLTYLESLEPVASRTVKKRLGSTLSSATIRNEMADLEEEGFLTQPHRSAGRLPTPLAIRYWIEELAGPEEPPPSLQKALISMIRSQKDPHALLEGVSEWLADQLREMVLLTTPKLLNLRLKRAELIRLDERRTLFIWVTTTGVVLHRVIYHFGELSKFNDPKLLAHLEELINKRFCGMQLKEIQRVLSSELSHLERRVVQLLRVLLTLLSSTPEEVILKGALQVAQTQYPQALWDLRKTIEALNDRHNLLKLVNKLSEGKGIQVLFNEETGLNAEGISVVGSSYGVPSRALGTIGVVGPIAMCYPRIIGIVQFTTRALSQALRTS